MGISFSIPIWLVLLPLATFLLIHGRKRWLGTEPHCRKCNYLLHGITSDRCPECGSPLQPAGIVHGQPHRRRASFLTGWLLLLLLAAALITATIGDWQNVNWYQYEPTYFVLRDLNSTNNATALKAWNELTRRDTLGSLSAGARNTLVVFALNRQANAWIGLYGPHPIGISTSAPIDYLGNRLAAGDLPKDQQLTFFKQSVQMHLRVRPKINEGDFLPYLALHEGLGPSTGNVTVKIAGDGAALDGNKTLDNAGGSTWFMGFGSGSMGSAIRTSAPPGKHEAALMFRVEIYQGNPDSPNPKLLHSEIRTLTAPFEVLPKGTATPLQPINDPRSARAIKSAITLASFRYDPKLKLIEGNLSVSNPPANIAFDVVARYNGAEQSLGNLAWTANAGQMNFVVATRDGVAAPPRTIDLILRPSEKAARNTVDMQSYWNQPINYANVPVTSN